MEDIQKEGVDPIEKQQEEDALKEVKEDEVRSQIIEKYGLEEDTQSELIDKLVGETKEYRKDLSTAIRQKIDWRRKAQSPEGKKEEKKSQIEGKPKTEVQPQEADLDKLVDEKLNERELASMDLSDELKSEVKAYAKAKGVSYREAAKSDYFNFIKGKEDEQIKAEEASISSMGKTTKSKRDFGSLSESEIQDLSSEEFGEYKKWLKSQQ